MITESSKVTLGELIAGLTVFQVVTGLAFAATTILALWSWRDSVVLEKTILQAQLIQTEARTNSLADSLKRTENAVRGLQQTNQELRADLAKRSANSSRAATCFFIHKEIASVKVDMANARDSVMVFREANTDREEHSNHLARLADQLRTLTVSLEACAR